MSQVVRGGAFLNSVDLVRCASRIEVPPYYRDYHIGFRVVLRSMSQVVRGGAFYYDDDLVRCASRFFFPPYNRYLSFGFRVVLRRENITSELPAVPMQKNSLLGIPEPKDV